MGKDDQLPEAITSEVKESQKEIAKLFKRLDRAEKEANLTIRKRKSEQLQDRLDLCKANLQDAKSARKNIIDTRLQELQLLQTKVPPNTSYFSLHQKVSSNGRLLSTKQSAILP